MQSYSTTRVRRSSLAYRGSKTRWRAVADRPTRFDRSGLREDCQTRPRGAADEDRAEASENLLPSKGRHSDLRHGKDDMIASQCGRQSEHGGNGGTHE